VQRAGLGSGNTTVSLSNSSCSQVSIQPGFGDATINLSDAAAGVTQDAQPVAIAATVGGRDREGNQLHVVAADADGNFSGDFDEYQDVLPTDGQDGAAFAHTRLDFRFAAADQFASTLDGTTLTLARLGSGKTITINNYQAGRISFTSTDADGLITASRQPPGLTATPVSTQV
jgi:hypothetical protein